MNLRTSSIFERLALLGILCVAAFLRFFALDRVPPGLNPDEAANVWNAWSLLNTGRDYFDVPWPIFYTRALGENRTTLFVYLMLPFQALFGLSVWSARLVNATGGVAMVLLLYMVGARLFDSRVGLASAALLALTPWHIAFSRWAHEGGINGLLGLVPLAALVLTGVVRIGGNQGSPQGATAVHRPRPFSLRAGWTNRLAPLLGGTAAGIACYGYPSVRIFIPPTLFALVAVSWGSVDRRRLIWLGVGFALFFLPLAAAHVFDGAAIGKRAAHMWLWRPGQPITTGIQLWTARYFEHFGPAFFFQHGDVFDGFWSTRFGVLLTCFAVLLPLGIWHLIGCARTHVAARMILVGLVLYPIGDVLTGHPSVQMLRSGPGIAAIMLCGGLGLVRLCDYLWTKKFAGLLTGFLTFLSASVITDSLRYNLDLHLRRPTDGHILRSFQVDLAHACFYLRPHWRDYDRLYFTGSDVDHPYVVAAACMGYDPVEWLAQPRDFDSVGPWDRCHRAGRLEFLYRKNAVQVLDDLRALGWHGRVAFIIRENESPWSDPVWTSLITDTGPVLKIFRFDL